MTIWLLLTKYLQTNIFYSINFRRIYNFNFNNCATVKEGSRISEVISEQEMKLNNFTSPRFLKQFFVPTFSVERTNKFRFISLFFQTLLLWSCAFGNNPFVRKTLGLNFAPGYLPGTSCSKAH